MCIRDRLRKAGAARRPGQSAPERAVRKLIATQISEAHRASAGLPPSEGLVRRAEQLLGPKPAA
eukprot:8730876-Alexandrium_andersonii.AAC.1